MNKANDQGESSMNTTIFTTFNVSGFTLLAISITLLFSAMIHLAQTLLANVGCRHLASVSWNG
jgi:hypothetical protein